MTLAAHELISKWQTLARSPSPAPWREWALGPDHRAGVARVKVPILPKMLAAACPNPRLPLRLFCALGYG